MALFVVFLSWELINLIANQLGSGFINPQQVCPEFSLD
ncbi:hypothetical protein SR1949_44120 [Sphaerospermopsis reniformis]|jgi:hypothetical protein|uniref:Uncharacterized protein n=1 Tax=Sphaerospermopsis reniformis TaxID=531300 RepID=A0A480A337_9CYAN|nr:hypothetical protein NIES73_45990 [Sphaerospermopsis kisseleviana NIES-73]GCL39287.1 hypothetical protein SR1949_44120 [Sphaerospermopsis reniformis]